MPSAVHTYISTVADGADTTLVRPSDWNSTHVVDDLLLQINSVTIASTSTLTLDGQERLVITDNISSIDHVIVGTPKLPAPNDVIPPDYFHNITGTLTLQGLTRRMSVLGSGQLQVFDEIGEAKFLAPARDVAYKRGRAKSTTGTVFFQIPGVVPVGTATSALANGGDRFMPIFVDSPLVVDQLALEITTLDAAGHSRVGIYAADTDYQPTGAPLADSGDLSTAATGVQNYTPTTPIALARGRYLLVHQADTATAQFRVQTGFIPGGFLLGSTASNMLNSLSNTRAYAAFPTPGTLWGSTGSSSTPFKYTVWLRVTLP